MKSCSAFKLKRKNSKDIVTIEALFLFLYSHYLAPPIGKLLIITVWLLRCQQTEILDLFLFLLQALKLFFRLFLWVKLHTSDVMGVLEIGDISVLLAFLAKKQYSLMMLWESVFRYKSNRCGERNWYRVQLLY